MNQFLFPSLIFSLHSSVLCLKMLSSYPDSSGSSFSLYLAFAHLSLQPDNSFEKVKKKPQKLVTCEKVYQRGGKKGNIRIYTDSPSSNNVMIYCVVGVDSLKQLLLGNASCLKLGLSTLCYPAIMLSCSALLCEIKNKNNKQTKGGEGARESERET